MSCPCKNNCPEFSSMFKMLLEIIKEKVNDELHLQQCEKLNKQITFKMYTKDRKIFHIKWNIDPNVNYIKALNNVLLSLYKPEDITHY